MSRRRQAFTTLELLLAMAIVAVLIALLFPAFNRLQASRHEAGCVGNLRQLGVGIGLYEADAGNAEWAYYQALNIAGTNQGTWSSSVVWTTGGKNGSAEWDSQWNGVGKSYPYLKDKSVYFCPAHRARNPKSLTLDWENPSEQISCSYVARGYNQSWVNTTGDDQNKIGKKMYQVSSRAVLSCFFMQSPGNPNFPLSWHNEKWPVLYGDGSIRTVADVPSALPSPSENQNVWATTSLQWRFWDYFDAQR